MKSFLRWCLRVGIALLALVLLAIASVFVVLRQSLPTMEGVVRIDGLGAPVGITRDALGIPTIDASSRVDAARALGFLHGQERFFQMDLMRRAAAGELGALAGSVALRADRLFRVYRFREAARRALQSMDHAERRLVEAYAEGVNAGLGELDSRPFEYWLLRVRPEPWLPEDSLLVNFAMWLDLQEANGEPDRSRAVVRDLFSREAAAWLLSPADPFDAPIDDSEIEAPRMPDTPGAVPPAFALLSDSSWSGPGGLLANEAPHDGRDPEYSIGSNSWAVAGAHTSNGAALVANDMHLGLRMPHIWYRAAIAVDGVRVDGVSLPGTPVVIAGSNGSVAWGFTNSEIDTADLVIIEPDPADPGRYLTADGSEPFEVFEELLAVSHGDPEKLTVRWTRWGPVVGRDHRGRELALVWTALQPGAADLGLIRMEQARTTREALRVAQESGMPAQNFIVGDSTGSIGWTIAGRIPRRVGLDGSIPVSSAGNARWAGWLAPEEVPQVVDPAGGFLWSANARVVGGSALEVLGDGGYAPAPRAARIRDRLLEMHDASPADMLALQLDNRALRMDFWRGLLVGVLTPESAASHPGREHMRALAVQWNGDADAASAGYRLIGEFRREVATRTLATVFARCAAVYPEFSAYNLSTERIVRDLVSAKPAAWLPADHEGWDALLLGSADAVIARAGGDGALDRYTWGGYNRLNMRHPLGMAVPLVGSFLDMEPVPMSGDAQVVNAQLRANGSSERLAIAPGHEEESILHMPGGQSGNPLSPHYDSSHPAWVRGDPSPLLPGPARHNLLLTP